MEKNKQVPTPKKSSSKGLLIATAVNESGYREVIGFQLNNSESETNLGRLLQ